MSQLTLDQINTLLASIEAEIFHDPDVVSVKIVENPSGDPEIDIGHLSPDHYRGAKTLHRVLGDKSIHLYVNVTKADPIVLELGRAKDLENAAAVNLSSTYTGMGGTLIRRVSDGTWGTASFSNDNIDISITRGSTVLHRCQRTGPLIISNAHVYGGSDQAIQHAGTTIGTASCLFDLNRPDTADYGHLDWTTAVNAANYFRIYDASAPAGKTVAGLRTVSTGLAIHKQGAKTGWTSGNVGSRKIVRVEGYSGTLWAWDASYSSSPGDSGSPVLTTDGASWFWVGVHFASGPHFWSWDSIGPGIMATAAYPRVSISL